MYQYKVRKRYPQSFCVYKGDDRDERIKLKFPKALLDLFHDYRFFSRRERYP